MTIKVVTQCITGESHRYLCLLPGYIWQLISCSSLQKLSKDMLVPKWNCKRYTMCSVVAEMVWFLWKCLNQAGFWMALTWVPLWTVLRCVVCWPCSGHCTRICSCCGNHILQLVCMPFLLRSACSDPWGMFFADHALVLCQTCLKTKGSLWGCHA